MPISMVSTYLNCKKTQNSFSNPINHSCFEWHEATASEISTAREFSGELLNHIYVYDTLIHTDGASELFHNTLDSIKYPLKNKAEIDFSAPYNESLKLSLEIFNTFDEQDNQAFFSLYNRLIYAIVDEVEALISSRKCTIAINFSETFLVADDKTPPAHFRPGIDKCVNNLADYKKNISKFSYNLAKAIFSIPSLTRVSSQNPTHNIVLQHYANNNALLSNENPAADLNTPLNTLQHFNCVFEACVFLARHKSKYGNHAILAFGLAVEIPDLNLIINNYALMNIKELIIILRGSQYYDAKKRQAVYEQTLALIKKTNNPTILQVILLTDDKTSQNLITLAPDKHQKDGAFSPLAHGAGYYLSSPDIFSAAYRNIQVLDKDKNWFEKLNIETQTASPPSISLGSTAAYIYSKEMTADFRNAKLFSKQRLKSNVSLSLTHQIAQAQEQQQTQALNQEQTLGQTQALSQQQHFSKESEQTQKQDIQGSSLWIERRNFSFFCDRLESEAKRLLKIETPQEQRLEQCVYYTNYYRQHHNRLTFLSKLAESNLFREDLAAKIFGRAYSNNKHAHTQVYLPNYSLDSIEGQLYLYLNINNLMDGLNPSKREISPSYFFHERTLTRYSYTAEHTLGHYSNLFIKNDSHHPLYTSSLAFNSTTATHAYQDHLNAYVLLSKDELADLPIDQQTILNERAEALLGLFKTGTVYNKEQILAFERQYIELIKFYFPDRPDYLRILEKFLSIFEEHTDDNLRIMLQIIICGHRSKLEDFFKLLTFLEERCLLDNFYKIYFKYALNILSVKNLLKNKAPPIAFTITFDGSISFIPGGPAYQGDLSQPIFTKLAAQTPKVASAKEWPPFEKLCHHVLLFAAKYNILFSHRHTTDLKQLWGRLFTKFLVYTDHHQQEAEDLLKSLVNHLITTEGLSLAPLHMASTLLVALEKLLDNAISKHTLKEQIEEIGGLSLLWMDTPYAIAYNGFQVACSEMALHSSAINPTTKRYSVSLTELKSMLESYTLGENGLKTTLFRYLGTETLREDIAFYRELFDKTINHPKQDDTARYIRELILGYFVATSTGIHYNSRLERDRFSTDVYTFLEKKGLTEKIPAGLISTCLNEFFDHAKQTPNHTQKGTTTLWCLCLSGNNQNLVDSRENIPSILTQQFEKKQLLRFILSNKDPIIACTPFLKTQVPLAYLLIRATIDIRFSELNLNEYKNVPYLLLSQLYPKLNMDSYIKDIAKLEAFINYQALFIQRGAKDRIYTAFEKIFEQENNIDVGLTLSETLSNEMAQDETNSRIGLSVQLLMGLSSKPKLMINLSKTKPLLTLVTEFYLNIQTKIDILPLLLNLYEKIINLDEVEATQTLVILLKHIKNPECHAFLTSNPGLTAQQLHGLTYIFEKVVDLAIAIPFILLSVQENNANDFTQINELLNSTTQEQAKQLLLISCFICNSPHQNSLAQLKKLKKLPHGILDQLVQLHELHSIAHPAFLAILESPSIPEAIAEYERNQYATNLNRYDYDSNEISEKISHITCKALTEDEDFALNDETQKKLLLDYQCLMSYMMTNPVLIEQDGAGIKKSFTINQLNEDQFHTLFKQLQSRITDHDNKHASELMLLALSCEALYRTTRKFPRNTQILSLINSLNQEGNLIHELKTGEGKSIIAALHGVLLNAKKRTVDIATENDQLAREGLNKFKRFYAYLGVRCSTTIIEAHSPHQAYIEYGINYSTAPALSLFRTQMQLENKPLPRNVSLVCDEIDATLTTTVQYRLAATINPLLQDKKAWAFIYKQVLDFVKEKDIFLNNKCAKDDDIQNLKNYLLLKNAEKNVIALISQLPNELMGTLIESAMIANELEEDIDYMVVTKTADKTYHYAAPILESTKRPDSKVSYSSCVQQLLHIRLNNNPIPLKYPFEIESSTDTLVVVSAKNFFDYYRLNNGRTIGFTGTAGTPIELKEFFQENALTAFSYPTFRKDQCNDLGLLTTIGREAHRDAILNKIREHKNTTPEQPILIITSSPKATLQLTQFLTANNPDWTIQSYCGYEKAGCSEDHIIQLAGKDNTVTIATQSLARGTDIDPLHAQGLFVINTCTDLTESDLRQIQGRAARNGKPGQFCSIIDADPLGSLLTTQKEFVELFKTHQRHLTLTKQKDRLKTRLLEKVRHHMVNHFLEIRTRADTILSKQYGRNSSLIPSQDFLQTISTFNQNTERQYIALLDNHPCLDDPAIEVFFEGRINEYQRILNRWLPEEKFQHFKAIEPLIPLEKLSSLTALNAITMDQLGLVSQLLSTGWRAFGHQQMQENFARLDTLQETFEPYFKKEQSFKQVLAETLQNQNILDTTEALSHIDALEKGLFELQALFVDLPIIGRFIPAEDIKRFIADYFKVTKKQIQEKKWDDLALPTVDISAINRWSNRISRGIMVASVFAGPIPFVVKNILIPTIGTWVTSLFKTKFATSKSTPVQLIIGLSDISSDLSNALTAFLSMSKSEKMTLGIFLDNMAPLLKNKAFLSVMETLLELNEMAYLTPYLKAMPELLKALDPYRGRQLDEALNVETIMHVLQQASQFEFIKKALAQTEYKDSIMGLTELKPEFISAFHPLSFPDFLGLLKVIAHPNFFEFLNTLPAQTTFAGLNVLLNAELENAPQDIKAALSELRNYQSNREKIEEDARQSLLTLKGKFMLSTDTLKTELARLAHIPPTTSTPDQDKVPQTPWLKYGAIFIGLAIIISMTILFFSVSLLLASIVLISLFSYPFVKTHVSSLFASKARPDQDKAPPSENPAEPILVTIVKQNISAPGSINAEKIDCVTTPEYLDPHNYQIYRLFSKPRKNNTTSYHDKSFERPAYPIDELFHQAQENDVATSHHDEPFDKAAYQMGGLFGQP